MSRSSKKILRIKSHVMETAVIVIVLTVLSGLSDSQGFLHAAKIWKDGRFIPYELILSAVGFSIGIVLYWIAIKYLNEIAAIPPELQALGWFGVTIISLAVFSGEYIKWTMLDQALAVSVMLGLGWLLYRTGG